MISLIIDSRQGTQPWRSLFWRGLLPCSLFLLAACTSRNALYVHPQSGATIECSGSGFGFGSTWVDQHVDNCAKRSESRGFVPLDKLTASERQDLESRGLMPKGANVR